MKKKEMITPYKKLSPENQKLWETMKYLYNCNSDKYFIKKRVYRDFDLIGFNKIRYTGFFIHTIELYESKTYNQLCPSIILKSKEKFFGYGY